MCATQLKMPLRMNLWKRNLRSLSLFSRKHAFIESHKEKKLEMKMGKNRILCSMNTGKIYGKWHHNFSKVSSFLNYNIPYGLCFLPLKIKMCELQSDRNRKGIQMEN